MRLEKWQCFVCPAPVDRDQQNRNAVISQRRSGAAKRRKLGNTGRTPACPEIYQNRAIAMQVLRTRLFDLERQRAAQERAADRKAQVGSGDRSERIRTYNFPQGRMTDHRINLTLYRLDAILTGDLEEIVAALAADDQARKLAEMEA